MRLIDADALKKSVLDLHDCDNGFSDTYDKACIIGVIDEEPTIEPERKKGEWMFEEYPDGYYHSECTVCGASVDERAYLDKWKYCPKCGARMRIDDY